MSQAPMSQAPMPQAPAPQPPPGSEQPYASDDDQNLAEMAQLLEARLRQQGKEARSAEPTYHSATMAETEPEPPAPEPVPARIEPRLLRAQPRSARAEPARVEPKAARSEPAGGEPGPQPKSLYDSLEQEMASLLTRPNDKN